MYTTSPVKFTMRATAGLGRLISSFIAIIRRYRIPQPSTEVQRPKRHYSVQKKKTRPSRPHLSASRRLEDSHGRCKSRESFTAGAVFNETHTLPVPTKSMQLKSNKAVCRETPRKNHKRTNQ